MAEPPLRQVRAGWQKRPAQSTWLPQSPREPNWVGAGRAVYNIACKPKTVSLRRCITLRANRRRSAAGVNIACKPKTVSLRRCITLRASRRRSVCAAEDGQSAQVYNIACKPKTVSLRRCITLRASERWQVIGEAEDGQSAQVYNTACKPKTDTARIVNSLDFSIFLITRNRKEPPLRQVRAGLAKKTGPVHLVTAVAPRSELGRGRPGGQSAQVYNIACKPKTTSLLRCITLRASRRRSVCAGV
ncbi:hypothetical protein J6590_002989 [Homalodisca vitripennis]|nr:hypothetical protein J6590_002989 [Homalodisca vitripennis]